MSVHIQTQGGRQANLFEFLLFLLSFLPSTLGCKLRVSCMLSALHQRAIALALPFRLRTSYRHWNSPGDGFPLLKYLCVLRFCCFLAPPNHVHGCFSKLVIFTWGVCELHTCAVLLLVCFRCWPRPPVWGMSVVMCRSHFFCHRCRVFHCDYTTVFGE